MKPIAVFFHSLFVLGDPPAILPSAYSIISEQMAMLKESGLEDAASEIHCGVNGGCESVPFAESVFPKKATIKYHGLQSRAENLTIVMLHDWCKSHPGWKVLYFHSKGATHGPESDYGNGSSTPWRRGMMADLVGGWKRCVKDLETHDIACSHWMWNMADGTQHIPAGNMTWTTSDFAATLPSMFLRERIKQDGIGAVTSRFEAEVFWGNGKRPKVKQYRLNGGGGVP